MTQRHAPVLTAFACGLLFGIGLVISGMTDPARIRAFLDVTGDWNPSLALVMIGAIATAAPFFAYARRREGNDGGGGQDGRRIDAQLVIGATIFGIGWGLTGICPGPAFVNLVAAPQPVVLLLVAMGGGLALSRWIGARR
ncbi:DUF6691 family protein [uncultured Sphingomonas sp.]|uniref:DUF6691 family protein n=1 Tax=uncultured Sphingomonas sp. TaxID=158754 RepID=UPI0025E061D0|nr:DUF6691 family protein [uncultured Sphingomonas sp.]